MISEIILTMNHITFSRFGNLEKSRLDFLLYLPHISEDFEFVSQVRKTANISLDRISEKNLQDFLVHEADTGVRFVAHQIIHYLEKNTDFSFGVLFVEIPRAFCDLNRNIENAIPIILQRDYWEKIYLQVKNEISEILSISDFVFHLHSMNNFDSIENSTLNPNISEKWFENHLNHVYSGRPRHCTLLTENEN